jgi:hypothetical protein
MEGSMPDLIVTVNEDWMTIDGPLPDGYRLIVHNHTGNPDFYAYMREINLCRYASPAEEIDDDEIDEGVGCFLYLEENSAAS